MKSTIKHYADMIVVELSGLVELNDCPRLIRLLNDSVDNAQTTLINLDQSTCKTSGILAACVEVVHRAKIKQRNVILLNSSADFNKLCSLFNLENVLPMACSVR